MSHITAQELALWHSQGFEFQLLDVRRAGLRQQQGVQITGACWQDPAAWLDWKDSIGAQTPVVVYCTKGHEIGQGLTATLRALGVDARYLVDGFQGWQEQGRPLEPLPPHGAA